MLARILIFAVLLGGVCWGAEGASDSSLLNQLNAGRKDEDRLTPESVAFQRPAEFPNLVLVGYRQGTSNFLLGTIFVDGKPMSPREASAEVMPRAGWGKDEATRLELAKLWVEKVMLAFGDLLVNEDPGGQFGKRGNPEYSPPHLRATPDGGVRFSAWIEEPQGAQVGQTYRRSLYLFSPDGEMTRVKMLERFYQMEE
ncbi:MAG: hypothetical protein KC910_20880 [Candidatus Eremiobacteraeota bacterium]|nr:hypothetical protein [Candidatus Eremiobacteraeota bacterium]